MKKEENFLKKIPVKQEFFTWSADSEGNVTLEIENKGFFNKIAQKIFKKPRISYVHLDKTGSFIWPYIDGKTDIEELGQKLYEEFKEEANPLYERLIKYLKILESYDFISYKS